MVWVFVGVAVVVIGLTVALASGRLGAMPDAIDDRPVPRIPTGPITGHDLREAHFSVVVRGYSMQQVDALLAHVAAQLEAPIPTEPEKPGPAEDGSPSA